MTLTIYIIIFVILIALSAFFSGSETGVYRLSRLAVRIGVQEKRPFYNLLSKTINDSQGLILSILIGNNIANYFTTSITTSLILVLFHESSDPELYTTIIVTPLLFVFGEVVPKSIYYYRADKLMLRFSPLLWAFHNLFSAIGLIFILKLFSKLFAKLFKVSSIEEQASQTIVSKHIEGILQDTKEEGYLTHIQNDIVKRVVNIFHVSITNIMVPYNKVICVESSISKDDFIEVFKKSHFTRYLVYEKNRENVIGYVNVYEAMREKTSFDLKDYIKPLYRFTPNTPIIRALNKMHNDDLEISLIAKARRKGHFLPLGIVTLKDLAEEITGEIKEY